MLGKLLDLIRGMGAEKESESARNGFLSYAAEVHSVGHGLYDGLRTRRLRASKELPDNPDVQAEPHYYKGAFVLGTLLQAIVCGGLALGISGLM